MNIYNSDLVASISLSSVNQSGSDSRFQVLTSMARVQFLTFKPQIVALRDLV